MNTQKLTTGEWKLQRNVVNYRSGRVALEVRGNGDELVATFPGCDRDKANARLIVAAPDLKAALENALRSMEYAAMALEAPEKCALRENIEQAKEALKKAGLE